MYHYSITVGRILEIQNPTELYLRMGQYKDAHWKTQTHFICWKFGFCVGGTTLAICESINSRTFSNANDLLSVCCFFLQTLALISHLMALAIDMSVEPWRRIEIWFFRWLKYWPEYKYEVSRPHLKRNEKKTTSACSGGDQRTGPTSFKKSGG